MHLLESFLLIACCGNYLIKLAANCILALFILLSNRQNTLSAFTNFRARRIDILTVKMGKHLVTYLFVVTYTTFMFINLN